MAKFNKIVLASSNAGKIKELSALLRPLQIELISQSALNINDADETGLTFIENAIIKARHAASQSGLPALADDSGLVIPALNGAPGIYSARYAGPNRKESDNIDKVLNEMRDIPDQNRQGEFHCVLALLASANDPDPIICHGKWRGMILREQRGSGGFGYDPIFFLPDEQRTVAELPPELKNKISHRALALQSLITSIAEKL